MCKILTIFLILIVISSVKSSYEYADYIPRSNLHNFMNDDELELYFGPKSKRSNNPDYVIIDLPIELWKRDGVQNNIDDKKSDEPLKMEFNAFGIPVKLNFQQNDKLLSPDVKIVEKTENEEHVLQIGTDDIDNCHYLHFDDDAIASLSNCYENEINGIILLRNTTLEIRPLTKRLQSFLSLPEPLLEENEIGSHLSISIPHIIKRASAVPDFGDDYEFRKNVYAQQIRNNVDKYFNTVDFIDHKSQKRQSRDIKYTIEVGLFFDKAAYDIFAPYLEYNDNKIRDMILAYMNGVQALYQHPSLGRPIDITIVYIEIMKSTPSAMPHYEGERGRLLDQFCDYQKSLNPKGDKNPGHWDMALYISGLDFFAYENGKKSGVTMGLATVGGVCLEQYACIIAEFGTTNIFGKPYPSAGFTSVYIMAHEMGHNIGMHHDASGNVCAKEGYIMSPSRGVNGETTWSTCSADVVAKLNWAKCLLDKPIKIKSENDAWKYSGFPGQSFTAKKQCEILLVDKDAYSSPSRGLDQICYNLPCRTPHRTGYYSSGPALDGTDCGVGKWCYGGICTKKTKLPKPVEIIKGGWSEWTYEKCNSGCTVNSKGYQIRRRSCNNPRPQNTDEGCEGNAYDVVFCDDTSMCTSNNRKSIIEFASKRCHTFSKSLPELDPNGKGLQAPHENNRLWMACAVFCRRADTGSYYTPRIELNDIGVDAYFPDGTWCHSDGTQTYYCLQHHCLPENFQKGKIDQGIWALGEDIPISGNAPPYTKPLEGKLLHYLSLDPKGRPLLTHIGKNDVNLYNEGDWANKDYIELPNADILEHDDQFDRYFM